ncbi:hypothetical protein GCM10010331_44400 [Streptomyces xanthochromogenes]|uniref:hypothetical protein n=1 Tax=Streptomyces xanthochromogenes TaxID=67384 RepID=UPI001676A1AF|nr:hypothetical protein [Streptomyces xanthochromogenes]GHB51964.1 hypothetical protein GCM10010331_44400 [Streptomyces xanthochromogenes]
MSPVNAWHEELNVQQHIEAARGLDLSTDEGAERFEQMKKAICDELRRSRLYRTDEQLEQLRSGPYTDERGEGLVLANLIKDLSNAGSVEQFDNTMHYVWMWGDEHRVWLGE